MRKETLHVALFEKHRENLTSEKHSVNTKYRHFTLTKSGLNFEVQVGGKFFAEPYTKDIYIQKWGLMAVKSTSFYAGGSQRITCVVTILEKYS